MEEDETINICGELWNDLDLLEFKPESCTMSFKTPIASGFRFRYQSEIDKKSFSFLKAEKNAPAVLQVFSTLDSAFVKIELVTEKDDLLHFNMLYEVVKEKQIPHVENGIFYQNLDAAGNHSITLESLGIRKMKNKEAMVKIKEIHPLFSDAEAKSFFNKQKDIVRLKVTLYQMDIEAVVLFSDPIKSQISKENKYIKIRHFSPKVVAEYGENLIVVLDKKITTDDFEANILVDKFERKLTPLDQDGQTFVFSLPRVDCRSTVDATFTMKCGDSSDSKPIKFLPIVTEPRKRKIFEHLSSNLPLKRPSNYDNRENITQQLLPESCNGYGEIQTDSADVMDFLDTIPHLIMGNPMRLDNDSSADSGIHSGDKLSTGNSSDEMESSEDEESEEDCIETEGFRRKHNNQSQPVVRIVISPIKRSNDSRLDTSISSAANKKILSEIARIGHDYAFGKTPQDLFERIEKQLPVVFTLQDDVGDTPLNNAILKGNVEHAFQILQTVQTHCDWALDLVNSSGHSALILAPACDVPSELIVKLLKAGCQLDLHDDTGKSAITYALEYHNVKALEVLLEHVKTHNMRHVLKRYKSNYYTPLQVAILNGFKTGVQMLLDLKDNNGKYLVDVNEGGLMNEETALHIAVTNESDIGIIEMLLSRPDIKINQVMSEETTALHIATKMNSVAIINLLNKHGAMDLPNHSEMDDSDEEMDADIEEMETTVECDAVVTEQPVEEKMPVVEMHREPSQSCQPNVNGLTDDMRALSLKGELKSKIIDILISSSGPTLNVSELVDIVKPAYKKSFSKYGNTNDHKKDIIEALIRVNCLPNSVEQLLKCLQHMNRLDLIKKIEMDLRYLESV